MTDCQYIATMGSFTEGETIPSCHRFSEIQSDFCLRNDAAVPLLKCPQHPPSKWNSEFSVTLPTRYLKSSASEVHYVMLQPLKTGALTAFGPHSHAKCVWRWQMWWSHYMPEVKWSEVKSLSHVRLFATPWTVAHQAPWSVGFSRHEYWSVLPFPSPGDLPDPGIEPRSPAL